MRVDNKTGNEIGFVETMRYEEWRDTAARSCIWDKLMNNEVVNNEMVVSNNKILCSVLNEEEERYYKLIIEWQ